MTHSKPIELAIKVILTLLLVLVFGFSIVQAQDYSGHTPVLVSAEYITLDGGGVHNYYDPAAFELIQRDVGNGQLSQDFVYGDPRNGLFDGGIAGVSYGVQEANTSADANLSNQIFWMYESANVWQNINCSKLVLNNVSIDPGFPGIVNIFFQTGQIPLIQQADLTQLGFLSALEFPYFAANPNVLGVAFTLSWVDENGIATDIDNNGKADVAFREIYYNDEFEWSDNGVLGERGSGFIDFPTVAIHESGHGLSAAHFGSIGFKGDKLVANPRAIMNAIYGGILRELTGRDRGSHCSNWAQWPNH